MSSKTIPFISTSKKRKRNTKDPDIPIDVGTIGDLKYSVYRRGIIHIYDDTLTFKKDCNVFEDLIKKMDPMNMKDGSEKEISGSGDNADLIFIKEKGEIKLSLKEKPIGIIDSLKKIINKAKRG